MTELAAVRFAVFDLGCPENILVKGWIQKSAPPLKPQLLQLDARESH